MTREQISDRKVAILATGDEITQGDIQNTNSQEIAHQLVQHGATPGMQIVTSDHIYEIETAIRFLLSSHDGLIITGGLGPTSDDLTRFALSRAIDQPLVFFDSVWEAIVLRLQSLGYQTPPESNRQQALFPLNAMIIQNDSGTAAGCMVTHEEKTIFMLPGPPTECLPMLQAFVLKQLKTKHFTRKKYQRRWLLLGVSEGKIAEQLDQLTTPFHCTTGYRLFYPYVEFKLQADNEKNLATASKKVLEKIQPFLIHDGQVTASELFREKINQSSTIIKICDQATGGLLENTLKTPKNQHILKFFSEKNDVDILIQGLNEYWFSEANRHQATLSIKFLNNQIQPIHQTIPLRGDRVKQYAVEFICKVLLKI